MNLLTVVNLIFLQFFDHSFNLLVTIFLRNSSILRIGNNFREVSARHSHKRTIRTECAVILVRTTSTRKYIHILSAGKVTTV